jgi:hydrogenase nickel incorporation protein HypA/HybF
MHELSIAEALVDQVRSHIPPGTRLTSAFVEAGALQSIDPECLQTAWDALTASTPLAGAQLRIKLLPWTLICPQCNRNWTCSDPFERCTCGNEANAPTASADLSLLSIEVTPVESPDPSPLQPEYQV